MGYRRLAPGLDRPRIFAFRRTIDERPPSTSLQLLKASRAAESLTDAARPPARGGLGGEPMGHAQGSTEPLPPETRSAASALGSADAFDYNGPHAVALDSSFLEPIREVWIHDDGLAASRLRMRRIMASRTKAAALRA